MPTLEISAKLLTGTALMLLIGLESWLPAARDRHHRLRHATRNLALGIFNAVTMALLAAPLIAQASAWADSHQLGLLRLIPFPTVLALPMAMLLFDGWMYLWHRANHEIVFLWRFHRVHHSDSEMDVTTAVRFHSGEILLSTALRLVVIPVLGMTLPQLLIYEMALLPVILFHHSNVAFPEKWDRRLRWLLVTPAIHRVHHSRLRHETDSNFSSVFSGWDRLAGTFQLRRNGQPVKFGLTEFSTSQWERLAGLFTMPFAKSRLPETTEKDEKVLQP